MSKFDPYEDLDEGAAEEVNPYQAPQVQSPQRKPLGNLAQSARGNELNQARGILIVIGVLTIAVNGWLLYNLPNEIEEAVRSQGANKRRSG